MLKKKLETLYILSAREEVINKSNKLVIKYLIYIYIYIYI